MRQVTTPEIDGRHLDLLSRWYKLRRLGLCEPIIQSDNGLLYTFTSVADPWGSREALTWEALEIMILLAERKPPAKSLAAKLPAKSLAG